MKGILKAKNRTTALPNDALTSSSLASRFYAHAGFPEATDSLAYDPVQRLLAVGTLDGRIKLIGKTGVEALLVGPDQSGTKQLLFLTAKAAVARVTQAGDLQLWGITNLELLDSLPCADPVTAIAQVPDSPYICLGCESGALQFVQLTAKAGGAATGIAEASGLELLAYELHADELGAEGALLYLSALVHGEYQRLLSLHAGSGALVWDIRHQCCIVQTSLATTSDSSFGLDESAQSALTGAGPARSACWIGSQGLSFATGHEMGHVLVWVIPPDASVEPPPSPVGPELIMKLLVSPATELAMPVRQLVYVEGPCMGGTSSLLVFGGQVLDQPDTLSLVSLDSMEDGSAPEPHALPWYGVILGFALVPQKGAVQAEFEPAAILVLMEGGQLVLFDLPELQPNPLSLPFQELPDLTVSQLAACSSEAAWDAPGLHTVTVERLRAVHSLSTGAPATSSGRWRWVFDGGRQAGQPPSTAGASNLLFTGHKDGRVRIWDTTVALPELKATVPFDSGGAGTKLKPVTALKACLDSGLLVVAHDKGEVRVYQFSMGANKVNSLQLSAVNRKPRAEEESGRSQPAGFQRVLRLSYHSCAVRAIAADVGLLACGDSSGLLSLTSLDELEPKIMLSQQLFDEPIACLAFSHQPATKAWADRTRTSHDAESRNTRLIAIAVSSSGGITAVDARSSGSLGPRISPKTSDAALSLTLLDERGGLVSQLPPLLDLPWAANCQSSAEHEALGVPLLAPGQRGSRKSVLSTPKSRSDQSSPHFSEGPSDPFHLRAGATAMDAEPRSWERGEHDQPPDNPFRHPESSVDEDSFLAIAAEEVEQARDQGSKRHRLKSFFKGEGGGNVKRLLDPRDHSKESSSIGKDAHSNPAAMLRRWSMKSVEEGPRQSESVASESTPTSRAESAAEGRRSNSFRSRPEALQRSLASSSKESDAAAGLAYLVVATRAHLRLYPSDSLQSGDRTTLRKVTLEEPICLASPFLGRGQSGLACISAKGKLQVYTLPGLEEVFCKPLEAILGFPWSWPDAASASRLQQTCSIGCDGQVILAGVGWEIARLALAHSGALPAQCTALYDWDLAKAAQAASTAGGLSGKRTMSQELQEEPDVIESDTAERHAADEGIRVAATHEQKRGLGNFLGQVRDGVVSVGSLVDSTGRELGKGLGSALMGRRDGHSTGRRDTPPSLDYVLASSFSQTDSRSGEERSWPEADDASPVAHQSNRRAAQPIKKQNKRPSFTGSKDPAREELFGNRERPGPRTADEIKVAYGRSVSKRSESAGAIASENRAKLEERGERLQHLNSKAENMAHDATDFAHMARKIRDREANRKWWQI